MSDPTVLLTTAWIIQTLVIARAFYVATDAGATRDVALSLFVGMFASSIPLLGTLLTLGIIGTVAFSYPVKLLGGVIDRCPMHETRAERRDRERRERAGRIEALERELFPHLKDDGD